MTSGTGIDFKEWIGRTETVSDVVTPTPYAALSATLDRPANARAPGTPLPALWHWLYFLPLHRQSRDRPGRPRRSAAASCPRCRCRAACGRAASSQFHAPMRVGDAVDAHLDHRRRDGARRAAPARWCSSRCATRCAATAAPTPPSRSSTTSSIAKRSGPAMSRRRPRPRRLAPPWRARGRARRRAAVPLLGADLQRPPHPLRPPLRDRGRGLSRPDRARPADRDAAARPAAAQAAGRRRREFRFKAVRPTFDLQPVLGQRRSRRPTARPSISGPQDHEGWLTMDATAVIR